MLETDSRCAERLTEACHTGLTQLFGGGIVPQQVPGDGALPELVEAGRVARQGGVEVLPDLTVQRGALGDQITAVADEQLQGGPGLVPWGFQERATRDRGAVDSGQVGIISLVAGIDRLAVLLGDKRMDNARLETGGREGLLRQPVIAAGALDGDQAVAELVLREGLLDLRHGGVESGSRMRHDRGWNEQASIEVGEQKLGAHFGAVEADDAEVLRTNLLHAGMEYPAGLAQRGGRSAARSGKTATSAGHRRSLQKQGLGSSHFRSWRSGISFLR